MKIIFDKTIQVLQITERVSKEKNNVYGILLAFDKESQSVLNLYLNTKNYELIKHLNTNDFVNCTLKCTYNTDKYDKVELIKVNL